MPMNAIVTGANSGISHAFAKLLIAEEMYNVIAADVTLAEPIKSLGCETAQLDVSSPSSIDAFKKQIGDREIWLLLNIAGVADPSEQDSLENVTLEALQRNFAVNTFGPLLLTQALLPNLPARSRVVVMSSRMGSISDNASGGQYAYRGSKAAVNALFKSLAEDLKKEKYITVVLLHPGIVKTNILPNMGSLEGAVEPDEAAAMLYKVLMSKGLEATGQWWHREGYELAW